MSLAIIYILLTFLLFIFTFFVLVLGNMKKKSTIKSKLPPSPPKLPIIGNLHQLGKLPHQNLWNLSQQYGPIMLLKLGSVPTLVVSSPHYAKQVLQEHDINFCTRPRLSGARRIFYNFLDVAFSSYGDHWRASRRIFVGHLMSAKRAELFSRSREIEIGAFVDYLSTANSTDSFHLDKKIFDLVGEIVGTIAFSKSYRGKQFEGQVLKDVMDEAMLVISSFAAEDYFPLVGWVVDLLSGYKARVEKCFHKLDGFYEMVLDEHFNRERTLEHDEDDDIVDALIGLLGEEGGLVLSKEHIKAILMNTFVGGVDTSAIVIVWAMCELMRNPRVMQKVQSEIRCKLGSKPKLEASDLDDLTYIKMIIKETLRLHPPAPLLLHRECRSTCQIRGEEGEVYDIYPKTRVLINAWAIGRDPNKWENPNEFYPERFDGNEVDFRGKHFEFLPFGGGRRICPGMSNSIATIELILVNLLYWFNWEVPKGMKLEDVASLEEEGIVTVHKRTHLTLVPIKYNWD